MGSGKHDFFDWIISECSEDGGETWQKAAEVVDNAASFKQGATQIAWGLDAADGGFLMDDITFNGITYDEVVGIRDIFTDSNDDSVMSRTFYDLQGRMVSEPRGGVFIEHLILRNGKTRSNKVVIK